MAGHSKWAQIKRKKAANDTQRGKIISKHIRAIQNAVREGGSGDPSNNLNLKNTLAAAKTDNVPIDNIERAIERALGASEGNAFETVVYEGYGPAGVAFMIEALTDNRNRTASEVRHVFSKHGGNMSGGTAWQFETKGIIVVSQNSDLAQEIAIEHGADDLEVDDEGSLTIYTPADRLYGVLDALQTAQVQTEMSQLTKVAQNESLVSEGEAAKLMRFIDALESLDDVQDVYSNANLSALETMS